MGWQRKQGENGQQARGRMKWIMLILNEYFKIIIFMYFSFLCSVWWSWYPQAVWKAPLLRPPTLHSNGKHWKDTRNQGGERSLDVPCPFLLWTMLSSVVSLCGLGSLCTHLGTNTCKPPLPPSLIKPDITFFYQSVQFF